MTTDRKFEHRISSTKNATKMIISTMNIGLRPKWSDMLPRPTAPTSIPSRLAAPINPCSADPIPNSCEISGNATPVMKTT